MKKIFFLITILGILLFIPSKTYATNTTFYEAEYIDNIYLSKYKYSNNTIYYQKARVFRQSGTNQYAYCIEPFRFFEDNSSYNQTITPNNLSKVQKERIEKIAYFGYGYSTHTDMKWYAITQYMIWQETTNGDGEVYFTDTLNGNKVNYFSSEIDEINKLIENYSKTPSIANQTYTIYTGNQLYISTEEELIKSYEPTNPDIKIKANSVITKTYKEEGEFEYELIRKEKNYNKPIIFYQSNNSQNLMETGDLTDKKIKFKVIVHNATITINKVDKDTNTEKPQGEASLDGAVYQIYNKFNLPIGKITIKDNKGTITTGGIGKHTIKEITPGKGYTLDNNTYEIVLDNKNLNKEITLTNKVIEKKIKIVKKYGEGNNFIGEKNIKFGIYNNKEELVKEVVTDINGEAEFTLPYGEYNIVQLTTTEGYTIVDPFNISVEDNKEEIIELKNYKIPVPDTNTTINLLKLLLRYVYIILC